MRLHCILYTTDLSESSQVAFQMAYSLARDHGARLVVLHVVPTGTYEVSNLAQFGQGESERQFENDIRNELQRLQPSDNRVPIEYKLAHGDPAASIAKVAEKARSDLIVLGTHGRTGYRRVLMGSVAEHVMRTAPCSVLVVKGPAPQTSNPSVAQTPSHKIMRESPGHSEKHGEQDS